MLGGGTTGVVSLPPTRVAGFARPFSRSFYKPAALEVLHKPLDRKRAVMTDRDGGFFMGRKGFNGHLPSVSGKYLPRLALAGKRVRNDQRGGSFLHHQQRSARSEQRWFLPDSTKLV